MKSLLAALALFGTLALTGCVFPGGPQPVAVESASSKDGAGVEAQPEAASPSGQPPLLEKTSEEVVENLSTREMCTAWQEVVRDIYAGTITKDELLERLLVISLGAPADVRAISSAAADALLARSAGAVGAQYDEKHLAALAELQTTCNRDANIEIMPR